MKLEEIVRQAIEACIAKHNGNITQAAKELGIARATVYRIRQTKPFGV